LLVKPIFSAASQESAPFALRNQHTFQARPQSLMFALLV
jgi:hypothetical protein